MQQQSAKASTRYQITVVGFLAADLSAWLENYVRSPISRMRVKLIFDEFARMRENPTLGASPLPEDGDDSLFYIRGSNALRLVFAVEDDDIVVVKAIFSLDLFVPPNNDGATVNLMPYIITEAISSEVPFDFGRPLDGIAANAIPSDLLGDFDGEAQPDAAAYWAAALDAAITTTTEFAAEATIAHGMARSEDLADIERAQLDAVGYEAVGLDAAITEVDSEAPAALDFALSEDLTDIERAPLDAAGYEPSGFYAIAAEATVTDGFPPNDQAAGIDLVIQTGNTNQVFFDFEALTETVETEAAVTPDFAPNDQLADIERLGQLDAVGDEIVGFDALIDNLVGGANEMLSFAPDLAAGIDIAIQIGNTNQVFFDFKKPAGTVESEATVTLSGARLNAGGYELVGLCIFIDGIEGRVSVPRGFALIDVLAGVQIQSGDANRVFFEQPVGDFASEAIVTEGFATDDQPTVLDQVVWHDTAGYEPVEFDTLIDRKWGEVIVAPSLTSKRMLVDLDHVVGSGDAGWTSFEFDKIVGDIAAKANVEPGSAFKDVAVEIEQAIHSFYTRSERGFDITWVN